GMVTTNAHRSRSRAQHGQQLVLDALVGVLDGKRIDGEVPKVSDPPAFERVYFEDRIPGTDHRRLHANVARPEARSGTISGSAVKRHADQRNIQLLRPRNVR